MYFNFKELYKFCNEQRLYSLKEKANAFNMGVVGYCCAVCTHPCKLGRDIILYINKTYGADILKRIVEKELTETWPDNEREPVTA